MYDNILFLKVGTETLAVAEPSKRWGFKSWLMVTLVNHCFWRASDLPFFYTVHTTLLSLALEAKSVFSHPSACHEEKGSFQSKMLWSGGTSLHSCESGDSPQTLPFAIVDLTSTVTAGNVPMVTVKMKHTDRAITQIWLERTGHESLALLYLFNLHQRGRWLCEWSWWSLTWRKAFEKLTSGETARCGIGGMLEISWSSS